MQLGRLAVVTALLAASCTFGGDEQDRDADAAPTPTESVATEEIPSLARLLEVEAVQDCMFKKNIRPDQAAIRSLGLLAWLVAHVESDRQLDFTVPLSQLQLLDKSEFSQAVDRLLPEVSQKEEERLRLLAWALGLSPHGIDVNAFLEGSEAALIAGLYDPDTGNILLRSNSEERATPRGIITLAHELTHAATDQNFRIKAIEKVDVLDDEALAYRSALEGDATLVEFRFISRFSPDKAMEKGLGALIGMEDRVEKFRTSGVPEMMIDSVVFPYQWGFGLVCAIYKEDGWAGINKMYEARPPTTSAQVMFPQRYIANEGAVKPPPLPKLDRPWKSIASGSIGAAHLKSLFEAPGNIGTSALSKPTGRAAAWAGGTYELWRSPNERVGSLALGLVEHERYPDMLCTSMREWYEAAFPEVEMTESADAITYADEEQSAVIRCDGSDVRIGISPDEQIAEELAL